MTHILLAKEAQHSAKYLMITTDQIAAKGDCFTLFTPFELMEDQQKIQGKFRYITPSRY